jgi:hypothetical protein
VEQSSQRVGVDHESTELLARRYFPDRSETDVPIQGEVRVESRQGGVRIRTLIYTRLLKRVVAELADKIEGGWPSSSPLHEDAARYVSAVESARDEIWSRWRLLSTRERVERRQDLVIDFELGATSAVIRIAIPDLETDGGDLRVVALEALPGPSVSERFVRAEAVRILRDRFPQRADELIARTALHPEAVLRVDP